MQNLRTRFDRTTNYWKK